MASIVERLTAYARSPQGKKVLRAATARVGQAARDPRTQARVKELGAQVRERVQRRRRG